MAICTLKKLMIIKFTYVGENSSWSFRNSEEVHEGCFMLDAIAGYYINR